MTNLDDIDDVKTAVKMSHNWAMSDGCKVIL